MTTIPGQVREIRYERRPGKFYRHAFKPGVRMRANADGSVTLRGPRVIHADDRSPGFNRYLENPRPKMTYRIAMAVGQDAGNKSMRAAGRKAWNTEDRRYAYETFARLWDKDKDGNNPMKRRSSSGSSSNMLTYLLVGGLAYWIFFKGGAVSWTSLLSGGLGSGTGGQTMTQAQLATLNALGSAVLLMGVLTDGSAALSDGSIIRPNGTLLEAGQF